MSEYDPNALEAFDKYRSLIDGLENCNNETEINEQRKRYTPSTVSNVQSMENILSKFSEAIGSVEGLKDQDHKNKNRQTLQQIQETYYNKEYNSLNIGEYSIVKNDSETYDLYDDHHKLIINNIMLYETVYSVASHLYRGLPYNSSKIMSLLKLNESYEKFLTDAKYTKQQFNKYQTDMDFDEKEVQRSKFNENKSKASFYKKSIVKEYNNITR